MKIFKKYFVISILVAAFIPAIVASFISACETITPQTNFSGKLISHSDCKSGELSVVESVTTDTLSCIEYKFNTGDNSLHLKHINSAFNCCPGEIFTSFKLSNDTIIVTESEREPGCKCNCLYDLEFEISGVTPKSYYFRIVEPYVEEQKKLDFTVDFTKVKEGSVCVTRKIYPWGMSQSK
jgi:hypothetical protein